MKISIPWLKEYVEIKEKPEALALLLSMAGLAVESIEKDARGHAVLDIEITSNRADWLSHLGVAREICALKRRRLKYPHPVVKKKSSRHLGLKVINENLKSCSYYTACLLEDVEVGPTPKYIRERLESVGLRSVNLIVDVTNFCLMESGQPMHAFDYDLIRGGKLVVRKALDQEKFTAINGTQYKLTPEDLVIADAQRAVALAGVMGGIETEVREKTRNVLLESALFHPSGIRRSSLRHGLSSDSSYRFERGVDPLGVDRARERAIELIQKHALQVGKISTVVRVGKINLRPARIKLDYDYVNRILGLDLNRSKIKEYLKALEILPMAGKSGKVNFTIPTYRLDLKEPIDLVEEVARTRGYAKIPETLPVIEPQTVCLSPSRALQEKVRESLFAQGFSETITFSLVREKFFTSRGISVDQWTRIRNPQNKELTLMRPTILPSLLEVLRTNCNAGNGPEFRYFETANVYGVEKANQLPEELTKIAFVLAGKSVQEWQKPARDMTFYDLKRVAEEIFRIAGCHDTIQYKEIESDLFSLLISCHNGKQQAGTIGVVSDAVLKDEALEGPVFFAELDVNSLSNSALKIASYQKPSKYPAVVRDLALVVKCEIEARSILESVKRFQEGKVIEKVDVVDLWESDKLPAGCKSLVISVTYRAKDRTFSPEEIQGFHDQLLAKMNKEFGATLRSA